MSRKQRALVAIPSGSNKPDVRIDTVRLSHPIDHGRRIALGYDAAKRVSGYKVPLGEHVTLDILPDLAALEVSLPNHVNKSNVQCLKLEDARDAARRMYCKVARRVPWASDCLSPLTDLKLARVDLVVDFTDVHDTARVLDRVDRNSRRTGIPTERHANSGETLLLKRYRWSCTLYDKHLESGGEALEGHLRCEARLRSGRLDSPWADTHGGRVRCLADISEEGMARMMRATFDEVRFGDPLCSSAGFDDAVRAATDLSPMEKVKLSGFHRQPQCLNEVSRPAAKLYRVRAPLLAAGVPGAQRLDLESGRLVRCGLPGRRQTDSECAEFRRSRLEALPEVLSA
jgi:hypothetical protein